MGELADAAKNLAEPITKLIESVSRGIGVIYEPRHTRRMADAKKYEINQICQGIRENSDIFSAYENGAVSACIPEYKGLVTRSKQREEYSLLQEQINIENVIDEAASILQAENVVSDTPVDPDWIASFFDYTKSISNKEMQVIWAKILAEEIKAPGQFSLRTLSIIRNITAKEAQTFQKVLPFVLATIDDDDPTEPIYFICSDNKLLRKYGVVYNDLSLLAQSGLISIHGLVTMTVNAEQEIYSSRYVLVPKSITEDKQCQFGIYQLTKSGTELYGILSPESNLDYLIDICNSLSKDVFGQKKSMVSIYERINDAEAAITYKTEPIYTNAEKVS